MESEPGLDFIPGMRPPNGLGDAMHYVDPQLLSWIQRRVADAEFVDRAHGTISTELCMQRNVCLGKIG